MYTIIREGADSLSEELTEPVLPECPSSVLHLSSNAENSLGVHSVGTTIVGEDTLQEHKFGQQNVDKN